MGETGGQEIKANAPKEPAAKKPGQQDDRRSEGKSGEFNGCGFVSIDESFNRIMGGLRKKDG